MRNEKGQALLIAVLLMTVILLVGAIFVAIVIYVQAQTARHGDLRQAKAMADGGIQHADRMLQRHTADWRPPEPPAWCAGTDTSFVALDDIFDPSTSGNDEFDPGFWGPDGIRETEDDYYTYEEISRGWCAMRLGDALSPDPDRALYPDPAELHEAGELVRRGFTRIPDPRHGQPANQDTPATVAQGHVLLRLTYDPDPPFEGTPDEVDNDGDGAPDPNTMSHMLRIESIGAVLDEGFTFRSLVAYKPLIGDHVRFVTDRSATGQPVNLGIPPWIDLNGNGADDGTTEHYITRFDGPVRVNGEAVLVGWDLGSSTPSLQFLLDTDSSGYYLRRDAFEAASGISVRDEDGSTRATVAIDGGSPNRIFESSSSSFTTYGTLTADGGPALADGVRDVDSDGIGRFSTTVVAPGIFEPDPATRQTAYEALTRYSGGPILQAGGAYAVNTGEYGFGEGIYINNHKDRQFLDVDDECDFDALMDDWLRNVSATDARAEDSGWNGMQSTYSPVGVEIWIIGAELPEYDSDATSWWGAFEVEADPTDLTRTDLLWSPMHVEGEPQIILRRHDGNWMIPDPDGSGELIDSGRRVMVIDHPCEGRRDPSLGATWGWPWNQVIMAAGNVRVWGVLPARPAPPDIDDDAGTENWDYSLSIVSGGTIYIDGSLLAPSDVGTDDGDDEEETWIALLAHDCVCLNATRIVPQDASSLVSATPDDTDDARPEASHWELTQEAGARLTSSWMFGAPIDTADEAVYLATGATGDDPGPSAISMSLQQAWDRAWRPYNFDPNQTASGATPSTGFDLDPLRFYFVPPGVAVDPTNGTPDNVSHFLSPRFQPMPPAGDQPRMPWLLAPTTPAVISTVAGVQNNLAMYWSNPAMTSGSTNPWVKKWKLVQTRDVGGTISITPAVHCRVNATMYAETGCWFIIPGAYFQTAAQIDDAYSDGVGDPNGLLDTSDEQARARAYMRYNYDIVVNGSITENFTAPAEAVYEWTDKWALFDLEAFDDGDLLLSVTYTFDESARAARDRGGLGRASALPASPMRRSTAAANLPRIPHLPVGPGLVYYGDTM